MLSGNAVERCYRSRIELMSGNGEALLSDAFITVVLTCQSSKESTVEISDLLFL